MSGAEHPPEEAGSSARALLRVDQILSTLEHRAHGTPYDVLGLSPTARDASVREAVSEQLGALRRWAALPDLPTTLSRRIDMLRARTEEAGTTLSDPAQRAALDVELGVLLPMDGDRERHEAFARELQMRRDIAGAKLPSDTTVARSHLQLARHYLQQGDYQAAHHLLRVAVLYDPYDIEARQACAACEARLPAQPVAAGSETSPPPPAEYVEATPIPRPPVAARLHLAGAMLAAMLVTTIASTATVAALAAPAASAPGPTTASGPAMSEDEQGSWVDLLTDAFAAIEAEDYERALALATRSQSLQASNRANEAITIASCGTRDVARARASYVKLSGGSTVARVTAMCESLGVSLHPGLRRVAALDLLPRAWEASGAGRTAKACDLASESMTLWPNSGARVLLVVCACQRDDTERARALASLLVPANWQAAAMRCKEVGASLGEMPQLPEVDEDFAKLAQPVEEPRQEPDAPSPPEAPPPPEPTEDSPVYVDRDISAPRLIRTPPAVPASAGDAPEAARPSSDNP